MVFVVIWIKISISILVNPYLLILVGALFGFLFWNWHPSKIFMGDVGSLVIGYILAVFTTMILYTKFSSIEVISNNNRKYLIKSIKK